MTRAVKHIYNTREHYLPVKHPTSSAPLVQSSVPSHTSVFVIHSIVHVLVMLTFPQKNLPTHEAVENIYTIQDKNTYYQQCLFPTGIIIDKFSNAILFKHLTKLNNGKNMLFQHLESCQYDTQNTTMFPLRVTI